ncbi:deoxyguanosinetriphosphate triphosphohydrolase [Chloroflexota bacterium]
MIHLKGIREGIEAREDGLSPHAVRSKLSRGRARHEEPCPLRTAFQRDRDRIIHSKAFRRLKHKTQVFIAPLGDHYVTRLTHTLEVAQIARTISRALNLNEDLTESIALGHDLGHTPFGHIGEDVLNELFPSGFRHNEQSLRVVDVLEKEGRGLNLTWEVRDGIRNHSKSGVNILGESWGAVSTFEGEVCKVADMVAYINHDIGDAIRAGVIKEGDLPASVHRLLGTTSSARINTLVNDIVECSWPAAGLGQEVPLIGMSPAIQKVAEELRRFLFEQVYDSIARSEEMERAKRVVKSLWHFFVNHEEKLPDEYNYRESIEGRVADYIAGMTDQYALRLAEELALIK